MREGDAVWDVFAGVGPLAVAAAARKRCRVLANDANPAAAHDGRRPDSPTVHSAETGLALSPQTTDGATTHVLTLTHDETCDENTTQSINAHNGGGTRRKIHTVFDGV